MTENGHIVESKWREADATALDERVIAMKDWLDHTEDLIEMFKTDDKIIAELRNSAAFVRTKKSDLNSEAEALRARLFDKSHK